MEGGSAIGLLHFYALSKMVLFAGRKPRPDGGYPRGGGQTTASGGVRSSDGRVCV